MKQWLGLFAALVISTNGYAGAHAMGEKSMAEPAMEEKPMMTEGTATDAPAPQETMAEEKPKMATGSVNRSAFTTMIENREPSDDLGDSVGNNVNRVYFFTELGGLKDQQVTHRWTYNGRNMAEVTYNVGSNRWRVWSSKNLVPEWLGNGDVIATESFTYQESAM